MGHARQIHLVQHPVGKRDRLVRREHRRQAGGAPRHRLAGLLQRPRRVETQLAAIELQEARNGGERRLQGDPARRVVQLRRGEELPRAPHALAEAARARRGKRRRAEGRGAAQRPGRAQPRGAPRFEVVLAVAGEELVGAVAGEGDRGALPREARDEPRRQQRRVGERLAAPGEDRFERGARFVRGDAVHNVPQPEVARDALRPRRLVDHRLVRVADRERLEVPSQETRDDGGEARRIEPAGQEQPDRHVRDELPLDRRGDEIEQPPRRFVVRRDVGRRRRREARRRLRAVAAEAPQRSRLERADGLVDRARPRDEAEGGVGAERGAVDPARQRRGVQERAELRREPDPPRVVAAVVERLDAREVAPQRQRAVARIEQREGEDAVGAPRGPRRAPRRASGEQDLRVAVAAERLAARLELRPQRGNVVELAVVAERRPRGVDHRLRRGRREVLHGEASMGEGAAAEFAQPPFVGAAMGERGAERAQRREGALVERRAARVEAAGDAAHQPRRAAAASRRS